MQKTIEMTAEQKRKMKQTLKKIGFYEETKKESGLDPKMGKIQYEVSISKLTDYFNSIGKQEAASELNRLKQMMELKCIAQMKSLDKIVLINNKEENEMGLYECVDKKYNYTVSEHAEYGNKVMKGLMELGYTDQMEFVQIQRVFDKKAGAKEISALYAEMLIELRTLENKLQIDIAGVFENIRKEVAEKPPKLI